MASYTTDQHMNGIYMFNSSSMSFNLIVSNLLPGAVLTHLPYDAKYNIFYSSSPTETYLLSQNRRKVTICLMNVQIGGSKKREECRYLPRVQFSKRGLDRLQTVVVNISHHQKLLDYKQTEKQLPISQRACPRPPCQQQTRHKGSRNNLTTGFLRWIVTSAIGVVLVILGALGTFTTVTCGQGGTLIQNGTSFPVVPMCNAFLGYDYLAAAVGVLLVIIGVIKIFLSFSK